MALLYAIVIIGLLIGLAALCGMLLALLIDLVS